MDSVAIAPMLWEWGLILVPLLYLVMRRPTVGLVASYCFQMWMLYWLGALIHAFPWVELPDKEYVVLGFRQATWGMAAFAVGALLAGPAFGGAMLGKGVPKTVPDGFQVEMDPAKARKYISMGLIAYFVLGPTLGHITGLQAVPSAASQLVVTGCCLQSWMAWHKDGKAGLLHTLPQTLLIPMVTVVGKGFMSYGVLALSTIMLFVAQFFRPRWILLVGGVIAAYMGLTVYVTYMRDRDDIRGAVWYAEGGAGGSLSLRLKTAWHTASTLDLFDPKNEDQLSYIDGRLNQNGLVGAAVDNLSGTGEYLNGSTIRDALLAMIPRLIWRNKPIQAGSGTQGGSGSLVTELTGIEFGSGTSVGIGPVLEFYGNFGTTGVLVGFFVLGILISGLDFCAGVYLRLGNWTMFTCFFLVGISCLNVSGSLVEITAGAMASVVVAVVVRRRESSPSQAPRPVEASAL
jgi:hypothetical protein